MQPTKHNHLLVLQPALRDRLLSRSRACLNSLDPPNLRGHPTTKKVPSNFGSLSLSKARSHVLASGNGVGGVRVYHHIVQSLRIAFGEPSHCFFNGGYLRIKRSLSGAYCRVPLIGGGVCTVLIACNNPADPR
jgi:hypothetical protein